jgi:DNA-binding LacI/PurR family transcriptional regulator
MDMRGIAKLVGVSSATASRVINKSATIRPETAERVQRVIAQLKFFPNSSTTTPKHGKIRPTVSSSLISQIHFSRN